MLELRQMRSVLAIAEHGTARAAARHLHLAPQSVAEQLARVERELGRELFTRHRSGLQLTEAGEIFVAHAVLVIAAVDRLGDAMRSESAGRTRPLGVGVATGLNDFFEDFLRHLFAIRPHADARMVSLPSADQVGALRDGRIDVGLAYGTGTSRDGPALTSHVVYDHALSALLPRDHRLARRRDVRLAELARIPLLLPSEHDAPGLRAQLLGSFAAAGETPLLGPDIHGHEAALASVTAGRGYTICVPPTTRIGPALVFFPVADSPTRLWVRLTARRGISDIPAIARRMRADAQSRAHARR